MTQFARPTLNAAVDDGITLSTKLNGAFPALYTNHAGAAAPPSPEKGQMWVDASGESANPPVLVLRQYTGTVWREVGSLNLTTGLFTTAGGLPLTGGTVTGPILFQVGTAAAPSVSFAGNTNTGMFRRATASQLGFSAGGVEALWLGNTQAQFPVGTVGMTGPNNQANLFIDRTVMTSGWSQIQFRAGTTPRWTIQVSGAESTANAGSNFTLSMNNDDGSLLSNYMQISRESRRMGINGAVFTNSGTLGVRTNAVAIHEDAMGLINANTDINGSVGLNFLTAGAALRGAIRGVRPGNNNGDIQIHTATVGVLNLAATFRSNGNFEAVGTVRGRNFEIGNGAGNGLTVTDYATVGGNHFVSLVTGDPAFAQNFAVQAVHVPQNFASVRLVAGSAAWYDFRIDHNVLRSLDNAFIPWQQQSDVRIKENIAPSKVDALATLTAIETVEFDFIAQEGDGRSATERHNSLGFLAQQVKEHVPEAIRVMNGEFKPAGGTPSTLDLHSVDNVALVPYLVKAIQQQQELIVALQNRVSALEGKS